MVQSWVQCYSTFWSRQWILELLSMNSKSFFTCWGKAWLWDTGKGLAGGSRATIIPGSNWTWKCREVKRLSLLLHSRCRMAAVGASAPLLLAPCRQLHLLLRFKDHTLCWWFQTFFGLPPPYTSIWKYLVCGNSFCLLWHFIFKCLLLKISHIFKFFL